MTPGEARKDLHAALGAVVEAAAALELSLRYKFCALIGSKYAAVVSAGKESAWLIDHCEAIVKVHREMDDDARHSLIAALRRCRQAMSQRNRLIHDAWAVLPTGQLGQLRSRRHSPAAEDRYVVYEEIIQIYCELVDAAADLGRSLVAAPGEGATDVAFQLDLEILKASIAADSAEREHEGPLSGFQDRSSPFARYRPLSLDDISAGQVAVLLPTSAVPCRVDPCGPWPTCGQELGSWGSFQRVLLPV